MRIRGLLLGVLFVAVPSWAGPKLIVSATVVRSCRAAVHAPSVGAAEVGSAGAAPIDVACTRAGHAAARAGGSAGKERAQNASPRPEFRFTKGLIPNEHTVVAEVLF